MRRLLLMLSIIVLLFCLPAAAQKNYYTRENIDSLPAMSPDQRIRKINEIMTPLRDNLEIEDGRKFITEMLEMSDKLEDHRMRAFVLYSQGIWQRVKFDDLAGGIQILHTALEEAEKCNCTNEKVEALIELGIQYKDLGFLERGFGYFMQATDIIKKNPELILRAEDFIVLIGDFYYRLGYYEKAAEYFSSIPEYSTFEIDGWHQGNYYNTAGLTFMKLKQYDMALVYFNKSLEIMSRGNGNPVWISLLTGNIGSVYYEMGEIDKAIPLLEKDLAMSYKMGSFPSAANAAQFLGKLYLEEKDFKKAEEFYTRALLIEQKGPRLSVAKDINEGLSKVYKESGNPAKALIHYQKFILFRDSLDKMSKVEELKRLELKHEFETKENERLAQIEALREEQEDIQRKQYATIVGSVLLIAIIVLGFYANRQRMEKRRVQMEKELELNKQELDHFTEKLIQKTNLIEELNQQLDNIRSVNGKATDRETEMISQLIDSTILTDDDWNIFKKKFEVVHRGFFTRLRQKYTDLTEGDMRLMALLKLNLSSKEIASMLGISADSVIKSRYRLRKKIGIDSEKPLEEFVMTV